MLSGVYGSPAHVADFHILNISVNQEHKVVFSIYLQGLFVHGEPPIEIANAQFGASFSDEEAKELGKKLKEAGYIEA